MAYRLRVLSKHSLGACNQRFFVDFNPLFEVVLELSIESLMFENSIYSSVETVYEEIDKIVFGDIRLVLRLEQSKGA